jgi:hypothetical protein
VCELGEVDDGLGVGAGLLRNIPVWNTMGPNGGGFEYFKKSFLLVDLFWEYVESFR